MFVVVISVTEVVCIVDAVVVEDFIVVGLEVLRPYLFIFEIVFFCGHI